MQRKEDLSEEEEEESTSSDWVCNNDDHQHNNVAFHVLIHSFHQLIQFTLGIGVIIVGLGVYIWNRRYRRIPSRMVFDYEDSYYDPDTDL